LAVLIFRAVSICGGNYALAYPQTYPQETEIVWIVLGLQETTVQRKALIRKGLSRDPGWLGTTRDIVSRFRWRVSSCSPWPGRAVQAGIVQARGARAVQ
jgi:hypothetical protein